MTSFHNAAAYSLVDPKDTPLSPMVHAFLFALIRSTLFKKRVGQDRRWRKIQIKLAIGWAESEDHINAKFRTCQHQASKKDILWRAHEMTGLSLKRIERIASPETPGRPSKARRLRVSTS